MSKILPNELELESENGSRIVVGCPDDDLRLYMTMRKRNYYGFRYSDYTLSLDEAEKLAKFLIDHVKRERKLNRKPAYLHDPDYHWFDRG